MQTNAYTVYDNKALVYGVPFFAINDGSAIRSFRDLSNDAQTTVGRHPGDFSLFCCGEYNDQNGALIGLSPLRHVVDATALLNPHSQTELPFPDDMRDSMENGRAR